MTWGDILLEEIEDEEYEDDLESFAHEDDEEYEWQMEEVESQSREVLDPRDNMENEVGRADKIYILMNQIMQKQHFIYKGQKIVVASGMNQGAPFSPVLYNFAENMIMLKMMKVPDDLRHFKQLFKLWADDAALLTAKGENLLDQYVKGVEAFGGIVNWKKSYQTEEIHEKLQTVEAQRYLGTMLGTHRKVDVEYTLKTIQEKLQVLNKAYYMALDNTYRRLIYKAFIQSTITALTLPLWLVAENHEMQKLRETNWKYYKKIFRLPLYLTYTYSYGKVLDDTIEGHMMRWWDKYCNRFNDEEHRWIVEKLKYKVRRQTWWEVMSHTIPGLRKDMALKNLREIMPEPMWIICNMKTIRVSTFGKTGKEISTLVCKCKEPMTWRHFDRCHGIKVQQLYPIEWIMKGDKRRHLAKETKEIWKKMNKVIIQMLRNKEYGQESLKAEGNAREDFYAYYRYQKEKIRKTYGEEIARWKIRKIQEAPQWNDA